jgi:outer membrane protein TolC
VLRNSIAVQEERVLDMREREAVGFARLLDVAQVEAQASEARVSLIRAENDARNARQLLSLLTGVAVGERPLSPGRPVPDTIESLEAVLALADKHRHDLQAAVAGIEATRQDVEVAFGRYWPSISLNVSYFLSRQSAPTDSDWTALLAAHLPLFTGGLIEADVRVAWSRLRQAKYLESFTRRQVAQEVQVAYEDVLSGRRRLVELQTTLSAARAAFEEAEANVGVGRATNLELIVAQDQRLSAELQLASEEFNYKIAYLNLLRAAGVLEEALEDARSAAE